MKLLVTYTNGETETYIGIQSINPVKNESGKVEKIVVESFHRISALYPKRETEYNGIEKMELFF
jgi:hypothetical protein